MVKKIYYIENTIDEFHTKITAYFETFEEAKEGLKSCYDWWSPNGTGKIYEVTMGLNPIKTCVYDSNYEGAVK